MFSLSAKPLFAKDSAEGFGSADGEIQKGANIARRRNALGRGLSALMSSTPVAVEFGGTEFGKSENDTQSGNAVRKTVSVPAVVPSFRDSNHESGLIYLSIDRVTANQAQPRRHFVQAEIDNLSESIKKSGLLQPIVVRRKGGDNGPLATYEIVAGERRWRAAKQAGLVKIPALLKQLNDKEALEIGIIENVQRADLNPIEEAMAYERLANEFGSTQSEIAETVGKDRVSIANALRLLKLPEELKQLVIVGTLSAGHARAVLMLDGVGQQKLLAEKIVAGGLSVRAAEALASQAKKSGGLKNAKISTSSPAPSHTDLEDRLRRALGTKVRLQVDSAGKGELRISFFSAAELERIVDKLQA